MPAAGEGAPIRVLLADDNPILRLGLVRLIEQLDGIEVVAEAENGQEAIEAANAQAPDIALLDVRMPVMDGLTAAREIAALCHVLMLTSSEEPEVVAAALQAGASGYLVHGAFDPGALARMIRDTLAGGAVLSPQAARAVVSGFRIAAAVPAAQGGDLGADLSEREREVMELIAAGLSNTDIARRLFLSEKTVKNHINRIFPKLDVRTRAEAIARWHCAGRTA